MLCTKFLWGVIALLTIEFMFPMHIRATEAVPPPPPAEDKQPEQPACVDPLLEQIAGDTAHIRTQLDKKKTKEKKKKRTFLGRLVRISVYLGLLGIAAGTYFVGVPIYREWSAESHYQHLLRAVDTVLEGRVTSAKAVDFDLASTYLIDQLEQEELLTFLRQGEQEGDEGNILQTADEVGLGRRVIEDSRRWEKFYRDTRTQKSADNLKKLQILVGRALQADWLRYQDQVGQFLASKMTMNELLQRQLEIYRRR